MFKDSKAKAISFSSHIRKEYRESLESLLFFNKQQERFSDNIMRSVDAFGIPEVVSDGELLRIRVNGTYDVQTIFAFDDERKDRRLIGIIIYTRSSAENIMILHIAVDEQYANHGVYADQMLAIRLVMKVKEVGRLIKGVRSLSIAYADDFSSAGTLPVR